MVRTTQPGDGKYASVLAMLVVVAIPVIGVWELFRRDESPGLRTFRLLVVLVSVLFLAVAAFLKENLAKRELLLDVRVSNLQEKLSEAALGVSDALKGSILSSLENQIAVLTKDGIIIDVNEAWLRSAQEDLAHTCSVGLGSNYLEVCGTSKHIEAQEALAGIKAVLNGVLPRFHYEYRCDSSTQSRWLAMTVTPLQTPEGGVVICNKDVSDVRRAEIRYGELVEMIEAIVWRADASTLQATFVSNQIEKILGFPAETWLKEPSFWKDHLHPDDRDRVVAFTTKAVQEKRNHSLEYRMIAAGGRTVWLHSYINVVVENGQPRELVGVSVDLTGRKHTEQELALVNERLTLAMESGKAVAWDWDVKSGQDSWFGDLETMFGITSKTYSGHIEDFRRSVHPEDRGRVWKAVNDAMQSQKQYAEEFRIVRLDGAVRWVAAKGKFSYASDGEPERMLGMAVDITERKQAERELALANEGLRLTMEAGGAGGWDWEIKSGRTLWFGETHALLGTTPDACSGSVQEFWDRVHPEDRGQLQDAVENAKQNNAEFNEEFRVVWSDGTVHWLRSQARFFYAADGQPERMLGISVDVTDRKLAEEALRKTEERFRLAVQSGRMFAYEWDAATDVIVRSGECAQILGVDESAPVTGQQVAAKVYPDDRERLEAALVALSPANPYLQVSYRIVRPDGTVIWVERNSRAQFDTQGKMLRVTGMVADITERKRAEESLRLFRRLIDGSNDAIEVVEPKTLRFLDANEKACLDLGYSRPELLSLSVLDIDVHLAPPDHQEVTEALRQTGAVIKETLHRRKDGSTFPVELNMKYLQLDRGYIVVVARDITERKRAEEALRESEERLRMAAQAGRMYAFEWDVATDVIIRSGECAHILGWTNDPTRDTGRQFLNRVHPDDRERYAATETRPTLENPTYQINFRLLRPDGRVVWMEESGRAFFDAQGKMLRIVGMVADVTERKQAEEALRESEARLRLAAQAARMYSYEWNPATDVIVRSAQCADILSWMDEPARETRHQLLARVHPDDRPRFVAAIAGLTPENPTVQFSYRVLPPDGRVIWLEKNGRAFFDGQGRMLRMIGMEADVTDRKLAEEAQRQREAELKETQHLAKIGLWRWDSTTDTVTWSEELYRIAGRDPNLPAPTYKEHGQHYTAESWERLQRVVEEALRSGASYELDLEMVRADGSTRWLIARGEALLDSTGRVVKLRGTVQDITERKREEEERQRAERRYGGLVASVDAIVWRCDPTSYQFGFVSQQAERILGYPAERWTTEPDFWREHLHPDDRDWVIGFCEKAVAEKRSHDLEFRMIAADGRIVWLRDLARVVQDRGEIAELVGVMIDVTERKRSEKELFDLSAHFVTAQEEERSRLARELHDDLSQRLALLAISLENLGQNLPQSRSQITMLLHGLWQRTSEISADVHHISHQLHPSMLSLGLAPALRSLCAGIERQHGTKVVVSCSELPDSIPSDVSLCLYRVAQEALTNIVKHSEVREAQVELSGGPDRLRLRIIDRGRGFEQDLEPRSGLGLLSMKERLRLVGGVLTIRSHPAEGTEIVADVPIEESALGLGATGTGT